MDSGNVAGKWGGGKMEEDGGLALRTMECLRGRLLAQRASSKAANEDVQQLGTKLLELEKQLKVEKKSRNRAEKKLKSLMKKLESLNISPSSASTISMDSEQSKSENSSFSLSSSSSSSTPSSCVLIAKNLQKANDPQKTQFTNNSPECGNGEKTNHPNFTHVLGDDVSQDASARSNQYPFVTTHGESMKSAEEANLQPQHSVIDEQSMEKEETHEVASSDGATGQDDSLALVAIDFPQSTTNPTSVQDVLDALKHAREKLQFSLERRHNMVRVASK